MPGRGMEAFLAVEGTLAAEGLPSGSASVGRDLRQAPTVWPALGLALGPALTVPFQNQL